MLFLGFTLLAEVEVWADTALVSNALDWVDLATITGNSLMDLKSLISRFFVQIVNHKSLESLSSVRLDLFFDNLLHVLEGSTLDLACSVTFSAWEALLIDLGSVTSEASQSVIRVFNLFLLLLRLDELTVNFLFFSFNSHLVTFTLSLDASIATSFFDVLLNL